MVWIVENTANGLPLMTGRVSGERWEFGNEGSALTFIAAEVARGFRYEGELVAVETGGDLMKQADKCHYPGCDRKRGRGWTMCGRHHTAGISIRQWNRRKRKGGA